MGGEGDPGHTWGNGDFDTNTPSCSGGVETGDENVLRLTNRRWRIEHEAPKCFYLVFS